MAGLGHAGGAAEASCHRFEGDRAAVRWATVAEALAGCCGAFPDDLGDFGTMCRSFIPRVCALIWRGLGVGSAAVGCF